MPARVFGAARRAGPNAPRHRWQGAYLRMPRRPADKGRCAAVGGEAVDNREDCARSPHVRGTVRQRRIRRPRAGPGRARRVGHCPARVRPLPGAMVAPMGKARGAPARQNGRGNQAGAQRLAAAPCRTCGVCQRAVGRRGLSCACCRRDGRSAGLRRPALSRERRSCPASWDRREGFLQRKALLSRPARRCSCPSPETGSAPSLPPWCCADL